MKRMTAFLLSLFVLLSLCACAAQPEAAPPAVADQTEVVPPAADTTSPAPQPGQPAVSEEPPVEETPVDFILTGEMEPFNRTWPEMQSADFWLSLHEDPQAVRMTAEEIANYNASLASVNGTKVENLAKWPTVLSYTELCNLLDRYGNQPDAGYYTPEGPITADQQAQMNANRNRSAVANQNTVQYGFLTENLIMRSFPSAVPLYDSADTCEYDKAAETALKLWEPVLVLHPSADGEWLLVQAYDYLGWVETDKVALCDREYWDVLCEAMKTDYLTVLAPRLPLDGSFYMPGQHNIVLKMGTVLPLVLGETEADNAVADNCHIVLLPRRAEDGTLATYTARIPKNEDVIEGCLPFTTENLLRQVFKLLGHRYGWGGTQEGWDCSSICQDVYRTMGIFLPRNSGNQRRVPDSYTVEGKTTAEKQAILDALLPGAMLELPGHQTMYIGSFEGEGYVIHATHGVYNEAGTLYCANSVIVSSVSALRSNGRSLMENFRAFSMPTASAQ